MNGKRRFVFVYSRPPPNMISDSLEDEKQRENETTTCTHRAGYALSRYDSFFYFLALFCLDSGFPHHRRIFRDHHSRRRCHLNAYLPSHAL